VAGAEASAAGGRWRSACHGKIIGKIVVFLNTAQRGVTSTDRLSLARRALTAKAQSAALTADTRKGVPFCAECERASPGLAKRGGGRK